MHTVCHAGNCHKTSPHDTDVGQVNRLVFSVVRLVISMEKPGSTGQTAYRTKVNRPVAQTKKSALRGRSLVSVLDQRGGFMVGRLLQSSRPSCVLFNLNLAKSLLGCKPQLPAALVPLIPAS